MTEDRRPIGYWLKEVDRLLESRFEEALGALDVGRRHWQVLNALPQPRTDDELVAELRPFAAGGPSGTSTSALTDVVRSLADRGWVAREDDGRWAVTELGRGALTSLTEQVAALRARTSEGVSSQDYAVTVATLRRMAENLKG